MVRLNRSDFDGIEDWASIPEDIDEGLELEGEQDDVSELKAEIKEWEEKYLRLQAEWDTYRRRMKKRAEENKLLATEELITELLPIVDDFDRSIEYAEDNDNPDVAKGVYAIKRKFLDVLEKDGLEMIEPEIGEQFDANIHKALSIVPIDELPDESICDVVQPGYKLGEKVLRPASVIINSDAGGDDYE